SHNYRQEAPLRLGAFPTFSSPFEWTGVIETDSAFHLVRANALDDDVDAEHIEIFHKPSPSPALEAARKTRSGAAFYDFARFPWARLNEVDDGFEITMRDLRFALPNSQRGGFEIQVGLDSSLRVRSESLRF